MYKLCEMECPRTNGGTSSGGKTDKEGPRSDDSDSQGSES
jgi:hypothetical protein